MPVRATKRGAQRTPLERDCDVLVCGASFAGLTVARELAGSGAEVLIVDRYEVGERQTSACGAPTSWLEALDLHGSVRQTFDTLVTHTPRRRYDFTLPWSFSTFDYRELCALLCEQGDAELETAMVRSISRGAARAGAHVVHTDRGDIRSPLVVDALGWKRVLSNGEHATPPHGGVDSHGRRRRRARLSRGLEVHPPGSGQELEIWIDPGYVRAGYGWSFPAGDELRVGVGSFEPRDHVKAPTLRLAGDLGLAAAGYQGNWIPHRLRPAVEDGVFFVGDSAGHCLPLTAEGIRPALYFGLACGRELRAVVDGRMHGATALDRYGAFSDQHASAYRWLLNTQHAVGRLGGRHALDALLGAMDGPARTHWAFNRYLSIAPPSFVQETGLSFASRPRTAGAA